MGDWVDRRFFIAGVDGATWASYCYWFRSRGLPEPPYVSDAVFVKKWPMGELVAGCCIYPCDGPYAVVEHVATNPESSMRDRHAAVVFGAKALTTYGAMRKKTMLCFPSNRGLERILGDLEFEKLSTPVMRHGPWSVRG